MGSSSVISVTFTRDILHFRVFENNGVAMVSFSSADQNQEPLTHCELLKGKISLSISSALNDDKLAIKLKRTKMHEAEEKFEYPDCPKTATHLVSGCYKMTYRSSLILSGTNF